MNFANKRERNAEICRRREAGEWPAHIADDLGLSRNAVIGVLNRAGLCRADTDRGPILRDRASRGEHRPNAVLSDDLVLEARRRFSAGESLNAMLRDFPCSQWTLSCAVRGITWKHVGEAA